MARLALIGGHSILGSEPGGGLEPATVETPHGAVRVLLGADRVLLQRHGLDRYRAAAEIDHRANLAALAELGCDRVLAIGSVGGLAPKLGVGTHLCPDDFIALQLGLSFFGDHRGERVPGFDPTWREQVLATWRRAGGSEVIDGGVYWQAIGPRFETAAEIRLIAAHADVIGMTIASECVLAGELGLSYAAICIVDNLANGIAGAPLAVEDFEAGKATNRARLLRILTEAADALAGTGG